jgi:hypothetical protein
MWCPSATSHSCGTRTPPPPRLTAADVSPGSHQRRVDQADASPHQRAPTVDDHDMSCRVGVAEQPDHGLGAVLRTG